MGEKIVSERVFIFVLFFISLILSFYLFLRGIWLVGPAQDAEYFKKKNIVVGYLQRQNKLIFNELENEPNSAVVREFLGIKFISQALPPAYRIGERGFIVSAWLHSGPMADIFQNIFLSVFGYSLTAVRISHIVTVILALLSVFLMSKFFRDFLAFIFVVSSSIFFYFSAFSISGGRYYFWAFIFINFSSYFLFNFFESSRFRNFLLSAIFCGLATASYVRAGLLFSAIFTILIFAKLKTIREKFIFSLSYLVIVILFFLPTYAFWIIFYDLDTVFPRPGDITLMRFFPRTGLKLSEAVISRINIFDGLKIIIKDIFYSFSFYFMGADIWFDFNYKFELENSVLPFTILLLSGFFSRKKIFFTVSLIYILIEGITFEVEGFPRRIFFIFPFFAFSISSFLRYFKDRGIVGKIFLFLFSIYFVIFQFRHNLYVLKTFREEGKFYEFSTAEIQEDVVKFLRENNVLKIVNVSALVNLQLVSRGEVAEYDWSFIFSIRRKSKEVFEKFFEYMKNAKEDLFVLTSWLIPAEELMSWANYYGVKMEKLKDFRTEKGVVFTILRVKADLQN